MDKTYQILAFDVGHKRIGVARASSSVRLVEALEIVESGNHQRLLELLNLYQPKILVVGLPYNKDYELSSQAKFIKTWTEDFLKIHNLNLEVVYQDETLSTKASHQSSESTSKPVDDLAAKLILEDYLQEAL